MSPEDVVAEIAQGVSPVCATCTQYWRGREIGLPRPRCATLVRCGSPIAGDTFSQYEGIITDFGRWCFVCASEADFAVQVRDEERLIGVCKGHVRLLNELEASEVGDQSPVLRLATGRGRLPLLQLLPKPKKGLFQAIAETEAEFRAEEQG
jgi:hypothetical protein